MKSHDPTAVSPEKTSSESSKALFRYLEASVDADVPRPVVAQRLRNHAATRGLELDVGSDAEKNHACFAATKSYRVFSVTHDVCIETSDGEYTITERVFLSYWWVRWLVMLQLGFALLSVQFAVASPSFVLWAGSMLSGTLLIGISLVIGLAIPTFFLFTVTESTTLDMRIVRSKYLDLPITLLSLPPIGLVLFAALNDNSLSAGIAIGCSLVLGGIIGTNYESLATLYRDFRYERLLPPPGAEFVVSAFGAGLPLVCVFLADAWDIWPVVTVGLGCLAGVALTRTIFFIAAHERRIVPRMYREGGERYVPSQRMNFLVTLLSVMTLWLVVVGAWWTVHSGILERLVGTVWLELVVFGLLILPLGYFVIGIGVQLTTALRELAYLRLLDDPLDDPLVDDIKVPVYLVDDIHCSPYAFATPLRRGIVVPRAVYERLDSQRLYAVICHEEAHATSTDAILSFFIPYIASVLLVGQNILYALFDYHRREIAADEHAARKAGGDVLVNAIERLDGLPEEIRAENDPRVPGFTPTVPMASESVGQISKWFGLFYGGFVLSQAHPSVEQRTRLLVE